MFQKEYTQDHITMIVFLKSLKLNTIKFLLKVRIQSTCHLKLLHTHTKLLVPMATFVVILAPSVLCWSTHAHSNFFWGKKKRINC